VKAVIKGVLAKLNMLERIQYHPWYMAYSQKDLAELHQSQLEFYKKLLGGRVAIIFDIGANVGFYTKVFCELADKVVAVDPDERNQRILRIRFSKRKKVAIVSKAVASSTGEATFYMEAPGSGFNTLSSKWVHVLEDKHTSRFSGDQKFDKPVTVRTTTLDLLMAEFGCPDFLKIDVEGFELEVLKGLKEHVPCLSFECNLPEFRQETIECIEILRNLNAGYVFNYINGYEFYLPRFVSANEMTNIVRDTEYRFFEIYGTLR
jgi:FkbM family methyltransferase